MPHEPRLRDYLTRDEVASLLRATKKSPRYGARNHAMILLAYRHGLRASEVVNLRVSDLDLATGTIYFRRAKGSRSSLHPMKPDEVAALAKVLRDRRAQALPHAVEHGVELWTTDSRRSGYPLRRERAARLDRRSCRELCPASGDQVSTA